VLEKEHKSLEQLYDEVRVIHDTTAIEYNVVAVMATELAQFVKTHDVIFQLLSGIEDTARGYLSPKIIYPDLMTSVIVNVTPQLRILTSHRLIYSRPGDVYDSRNFHSARSGDGLFIRLRMP
jgi:hypothetical protein